jgi:hypothetical protein
MQLHDGAIANWVPCLFQLVAAASLAAAAAPAHTLGPRCQVALATACPLQPWARTAMKLDTVLLCDECAGGRKDQQRLRDAGCTAGEVKFWCTTLAPGISRRAHFTSGVEFDLRVLDSGSCAITIEGTRFEVVSAFSEAGFTTVQGQYHPPTWHALGNISNMPTSAVDGVVVEAFEDRAPERQVPNVTVDRSQAAQGRWVVATSIAGLFTVRRVFQLYPAPPLLPRKVLVNDSIMSLSPAMLGTHVRHHARLMSGGTAAGAAVPGRYFPTSCGTENNAGLFGSVYHPSNFGRPDIWMNTSAGTGLGMVALDDAFRVHGECWQSAVPKLNPRVATICPLTDPPSIRLADPRLALGPGEAHTMEWALFPQGPACSDYFCFVNAMRFDMGTDKLPVGVNPGSENAVGDAPTFMINKGAHAGNQLPWNGSGWTDATQVNPQHAERPALPYA